MVLVDTSVWIEIFRRHPVFALEDLVPLDEVVTCLPVIQEVLQGFDDERAYRIARDAMFSLAVVESPMPPALFEEAALLYRRARRGGRTIRSGVDCLIAACAIRHDVEVLHQDRDFAALATVSTLKQRDVHRPRN